MSRRHFVEHLVDASSLAIPALTLTHSLQAQSSTLRRDQKAAILLWMSGGPSTIDLWDLKPGVATSGPFQPIGTTSEARICEHLPLLAKQMHQLSVVRSMSTREADHNRGRYYMHTGFVPNSSLVHPSYGSVISHALMDQRPELEIPPFVSVGGGSAGPGFLGMSWAPFVVTPDGRIQNLDVDAAHPRLLQRMTALRMLESNFIQEYRVKAAEDHAEVLDKTLSLMTSAQMSAFDVDREPAAVRERYGNSGFGRGCLLARRLVEAGVPFVEVDFGGWDDHANIFPSLQNNRLPRLDQGFSALLEDLSQRGLLASTVVIWMGEFGRTPRINQNNGRDHWARAWSVLVGGAGFQPGRVVGTTNADGTQVISEPYTSQDLMASVCHALGISLKTIYKTPSGRPIRIANGGKLIEGLFG